MVRKIVGRRSSDKEIEKIKDAYLESLQRVCEEGRDYGYLDKAKKIIKKPLVAVQYPDDFEDAMDLVFTDEELNEFMENEKLIDQQKRRASMLEGTFNRIILNLTPEKVEKVMIDSSEYEDLYYQEVTKGLKIYTHWQPGCTIKFIEKSSFSKFEKYVKQLYI